MRKRLESLVIVVLLATHAATVSGQAASGRSIRLDSTVKLSLTNARVLWVDYRGRPALKLAPLEGHEHDVDQEMAAVLTESDFKNGVIEVDVSGARREGYSKAVDVSGFKGIVGLSFRIRGDSAERFYIRPENSRVNDQLFRNRSTQYESDPDFPWQRLRVICRHRVWRMDEAPNRSLGRQGSTVRQRRDPALSHRERPQTRRESRQDCPVGADQ
jgi:hypothetical protein